MRCSVNVLLADVHLGNLCISPSIKYRHLQHDPRPAPYSGTRTTLAAPICTNHGCPHTGNVPAPRPESERTTELPSYVGNIALDAQRRLLGNSTTVPSSFTPRKMVPSAWSKRTNKQSHTYHDPQRLNSTVELSPERKISSNSAMSISPSHYTNRQRRLIRPRFDRFDRDSTVIISHFNRDLSRFDRYLTAIRRDSRNHTHDPAGRDDSTITLARQTPPSLGPT